MAPRTITGSFMSQIHRHALINYSNQQMFALVNDVAAYPLYMEGCRKVVVHRQDEYSMLATMELERHGIRMSFTTENVLDSPSSIVMRLQEGPFRQLEGKWLFEPLGSDACKVVFNLHFAMKNPVAGFALGKLFDSVGNAMVDAVALRAKQLYGGSCG